MRTSRSKGSKKEIIEHSEYKKAVLQSEWMAIPTEVCRKLVESMNNRSHECVKSKGGPTKYYNGTYIDFL